MKHLIIGLIAIYQKTLSPDHGWGRHLYPFGFCRFHPSCSEYAILGVEKFGVVVGLALSARRFIKCNPFTRPAFDPLPVKGGQILNPVPLPRRQAG